MPPAETVSLFAKFGSVIFSGLFGVISFVYHRNARIARQRERELEKLQQERDALRAEEKKEQNDKIRLLFQRHDEVVCMNKKMKSKLDNLIGRCEALTCKPVEKEIS